MTQMWQMVRGKEQARGESYPLPLFAAILPAANADGKKDSLALGRDGRARNDTALALPSMLLVVGTR